MYMFENNRPTGAREHINPSRTLALSSADTIALLGAARIGMG